MDLALFCSLIDSVMLEAYVSDLHGGANRTQYLVAFCDLVRLYTDILSLLQDCATYSSAVYEQLIKDTTAIKNIIRLLAVVYQGKFPAYNHPCFQMNIRRKDAF